MRYRVTALAFLFVAALCAAPLQPQTAPAPPKPGPEVKKLGVFLGKWTTLGELKPNGGKVTGSVSCEWVSAGFGILCHETMDFPGQPKLVDVFLVGYDHETKQYALLQVGNVPGPVWIGRGSVDGNTWTWTVDTTDNGKPLKFRFTQKITSPDSMDFTNEIGLTAEALAPMMVGKYVRVKAGTAKRAPDKPAAK
ncbi:MAG TPA: DUF1579 family protein [Methylomirabilota bacterium]|nr:DUF1579 family protein [Methylomirabilota bacterium]